MVNVIPFPNAKGESTSVDLFLRVGETSYVQIEKLYGEGRLPIRRAIFDASKVCRQIGFLKTLLEDSMERILNTKDAAAASLVTRMTKQSVRIEKLRSSLENLHTVRGLDAPRSPAAIMAPRVMENREH